MANSRQSATIFSPSSKRPTKRTRSSITEHSFQGIASSPRGGSVTYVSGTNCHPCVGSLTRCSLALRPNQHSDFLTRNFVHFLQGRFSRPRLATCVDIYLWYILNLEGFSQWPKPGLPNYSAMDVVKLFGCRKSF